MIVVDLEMSGIDVKKCGILQIGAVDSDNPTNTFFQEARMKSKHQFVFDGNWKGKKPEETLGKTEEELRSKNRQTEKQLLINFFEWCEKVEFKNLACQGFLDMTFLEQKALEYGLAFPVSHRVFDTHIIAQMKYFELNKKLLTTKSKIQNGTESDMGMKNILELVGMEDKRTIHNALEDAKLTAEALSRLLYGKNLLEEYKQFPIPDYLKK